MLFSCAFDVQLHHRCGRLCVVSCQCMVALSGGRVLWFRFSVIVLVDFAWLLLVGGAIILPICAAVDFFRCVCVCVFVLCCFVSFRFGSVVCVYHQPLTGHGHAFFRHGPNQ